MTDQNIASTRLQALKIENSRFTTPAQVISRLGAMQAQDYQGALWGIGLRGHGISQTDVEKAIKRKEIIRTWPMRGTLHFVAAPDIKWMLELMAQRVISGSASRWKRLELSDEVFARATELLTKALQGGKQFTRPEMYAVLEADNIATANQRGNHIIWRLALQQTLCFGSHVGKKPTYALLDEMAPDAKVLPKDEALAELTKRYFVSHGPATIQDMMWWSGLPSTEVKRGITLAGAELESESIDNKTYWYDAHQEVKPSNEAVHLLPAFDEYLLGYRDRSAVLNLKHAQKVVPGSNGMFMPIIVSGGQVKAIWKRTVKTKSISLQVVPFESITKKEITLLGEATKKYAEFSGLPIEIA